LLEKGARFRFDRFLGRLFGVHCAVDPYNLDAFELPLVPQLVEQEVLVVKAFVVAREMRHRYGEASGRGGLDRAPLQEPDDPGDAWAFFEIFPVRPNVKTCAPDGD